jgi:ubiquinone/menaquinone biosynthesis C-methylase UbiE
VNKKANLRANIMKVIVSIGFLFLLLRADAQKMERIPGHCGYYYRSMEDLYRQKQTELDFYSFKPGQVVASIGAHCGNWEAAFASTTDSIHFYLEDIDTNSFKKSQIAFVWHYYDSLSGKAMTSNYTMITGTEEATLLPDNTFDKIIIINSFHEFIKKDEMLADIITKLKPGGILYIDEAVPKKQGELHVQCKKPMLTPEEMISVLTKNGYEYVDGLEVIFIKKRPMRKIYAFRKKG